MSDITILTAPETADAIQRHAVACFPEEACGVITASGFHPLPNRHPEPGRFFDCGDDAAEFQMDGSLLAVVHSHAADQHSRVLPNYPSEPDMRQQVAMGVPWGLCVSSAAKATTPWFWGGDVAIPPLVGRKFRHGPSGTDGRGDCYALIRDYYKLQHAIDLPEFPRGWAWWNDEGVDLYETGFRQAGFEIVAHSDVRVADVGLIVLPIIAPDGRAMPAKPIHGCISIGDGQVLHHKQGRLSIVEHLQSWNHLTKYWIRHHALA